jgi:spore coat polysaccharide biosynthesis predicted glycosyltransferase SpsG
MMTCIIRVDASNEIGYGHLMRCLALGEELRKSFDILYVVRHSDSINKIRQHGFRVYEIPSDVDDEVIMISLTSKFPNAIWIIDIKKQFSKGFLPELKRHADLLLLIENLSYDMEAADGVLFPAAHLDEKILDPWLDKKERYRVLSGWDWIILRDELLNIAPITRDFPLVVTTGGSDPEGVFFRLWDLLKDQKIHAIFLVGESFSFRDNLPNEDEHLKVKDYDVKYIARACSVISTFGSSITECLYLKKPVISVTHSIENAHGSSVLSRKSPACFDLGYFKDLDRETLIHAINTYQEPSKEIMDWLNGSPIDGKGAERVKQWLIEKTV